MCVQVASDAHADIHRSLYRLMDVLKPDLETSTKLGEGLSLTEDGAQIIEEAARLAAYNLRYNPRSLRSWDSLASKPQHPPCT